MSLASREAALFRTLRWPIADFPPSSTDALNQTIELLKLPENTAKMDMAKAQMAAQPDNIMMLMMLVLPVATQVCMPVLTKFGSPRTRAVP